MPFAAAACLALMSMAVAAPARGAGWELRQLPIGEIERVPPGFRDLHAAVTGVDCPSPTLCVAVGESDAIASSTNPTGGAGSWQIVRPFDQAVETDNKCFSGVSGEGPPAITECPMPPTRVVRAVSCPSTGLCVAVTFEGYVLSSTDPTGPASSWRVADVDGPERDTHLESVSCPDPGFCVAVSGNRYTAGKVLTSTNPTGPGSAWQVVQLDESLDLRGVSCSSRDFCLAVAHGGHILVSTNPGGGASDWREIGTPGGTGNLESVDCLDADSFLCVTGNAGGNLLTTKAPSAGASSWSEANGGSSVQITAVSCPTPSQCVAVDNNGNVIVSSDAGGPSGSWAASNLVPFGTPSEKEQPLNALFAASCPTVTLCVLGGAKGRVFTNAEPFAAAPASPQSGQKKGTRRLRKRPRTIIVKADRFREYTRKQRLKVSFRFFARSQVKGFVCKRDRGRYKRCRSPLRYWVPLGPHILRVRAIGPTGLRGPAATIRFSALRNPYLK